MRNKQRHGCLTAWLIYLIVAYSIVSFSLLFDINGMSKKVTYITSENVLFSTASIGILNIMLSFMLLRWVKFAFWGLLATNIILSIIQIINSNNIFSPFMVLIFLMILYGLLQLKKNNVSGWDNLE